MAKITWDVSDVEEFEAYAGPTPKRGKYEAVIRSAEYGPSKSGTPMFTIMVVLDSKKKDRKQYNGCPLWQYVTVGDLSEEWMRRNMKMIVRLAGLKEKGSATTEAILKKLDGKRVFVLVKNEMYGEELVARANGLYEFSEKEDDDEAVAGDDEDEDEEETGTEDEDEDEDEDEGEEDEDEDEATVEDEIAELDRAGLKQYIKDNELDITPKKSWSDDKLREAIVAAYEEDEEEGEPPF